MPYNLSLTNDNLLTTLDDGQVNTSSTSLTLIGKNYPGYGTFMNENFIHLLEHFASGSGPSNPLPGQLWWDSTNAILKVNAAAGPGTPIWKNVSSSTSSLTEPPSAIVGDLWWDTANSQLKIYSGAGTSWVTIGPTFTAATGVSGAIADTITATDGPHIIVKLMISNAIIAIISKDAPFTPIVPVPGFTGTIKAGINFATQSPGLVYYGDSNAALNLKVGTDLVPSSIFLRSDVSVPTTTKLQIGNDGGLEFGTGGYPGRLNVSGSTVQYKNNASNGDVVFFVKRSGIDTTVLRLNGTTGLAETYTAPLTSNDITNKDYVDTANVNLSNSVNARIAANIQTTILRDGSTTIQGNIVPQANVTYSLGSSTARFANVWASTLRGTAVTAQYADLAERFEADYPYTAGTVVQLGGEKEITAAAEDLSEDVFGVISDRAAFLMNGEAGTNETHPAVAVTGRVPVNVVGKVKKGDRLVSAGNGMARVGAKHELTAWNVIGRSLTTKTTDGEGTVEAIVKLNS